jgi:predicted transcriptional regulator
LRVRGAGPPKKRIASQLGLDPMTVRRYLEAAATAGVPVCRCAGDGDDRR